VNLITIGEGYGICNSVWMYRTKLEKIAHSSEYFHPIRLGFWYWDTWNNRMIDTEYSGFGETEMTPYFYGGTGKMEIYYGEKKTLTITDSENVPIANKPIVLSEDGDDYRQTLTTDATGKIVFDLLTVRHFKYGNSQEHDGVTGTPTQTNYNQYVFNVDGYKPYGVTIAQLKNATVLKIGN
jgi:hypothetical protein